MAALHLIAGHADIVGGGGPTQGQLRPVNRGYRERGRRRRRRRVGDAVECFPGIEPATGRSLAGKPREDIAGVHNGIAELGDRQVWIGSEEQAHDARHMSGRRRGASEERIVGGARRGPGHTADPQIIEIHAIRVPRVVGEKVDTEPVGGTRVAHLSKQKIKERTTSVA